jgi:hypothetical protein
VSLVCAFAAPADGTVQHLEAVGVRLTESKEHQRRGRSRAPCAVVADLMRPQGDPQLTREPARGMEHTKSCSPGLDNMNHEPKQFRRPRW